MTRCHPNDRTAYARENRKGVKMETLTFKGKAYITDADGFLADPNEWDEDFAIGLAPTLGIPQGLTEEHWEVIHFIRETCEREGKCPLVFQTCRANKLRLKDLQRLFPAGYLRGACKLAGITYMVWNITKDKEGWFFPCQVPGHAAAPSLPEKTYTIDARGFLVNPDNWDEQYTLLKAHEMGMPEGLTERHWQVIHFLRDSFKKMGVVPTVYETCDANNLEIDDLERLFPQGYQRGAVKMAGLRVR